MSSLQEIILTPAEKFIHLSSEYALETNSSPADCHFRVSLPVTTSNESYCMLVGVHNATIPHSWYNIFGVNWSITFYYNSIGKLSGTIPYQNYSPTLLASSLQTSVNNALIAAGSTATFSVTYTETTNYMTFNNSGGNFVFEYVPQSIYLELGLRFLYQGKITSVSSAFNGTTFTITPSAMVDLSAFHGIYVLFQGYNSNALSSYSNLSQTPILARIPIQQPFGAIETYEPSNITYVPLPTASLTDIHISLVGDDGEQLALNGLDWTMTLHVKYAAIRQPEAPTEKYLAAGSMFQEQVFGGRKLY